MRTTLDIDEDVLQAAKDLAAMNRTTIGKMLSRLARRGLAARVSYDEATRSGVPVLPPRADEGLVDLDTVNELRDQT